MWRGTASTLGRKTFLKEVASKPRTKHWMRKRRRKGRVALEEREAKTTCPYLKGVQDGAVRQLQKSCSWGLGSIQRRVKGSSTRRSFLTLFISVI